MLMSNINGNRWERGGGGGYSMLSGMIKNIRAIYLKFACEIRILRKQTVEKKQNKTINT